MKLILEIKKRVKKRLLNSEAKNVPVIGKRSYDKILL